MSIAKGYGQVVLRELCSLSLLLFATSFLPPYRCRATSMDRLTTADCDSSPYTRLRWLLLRPSYGGNRITFSLVFCALLTIFLRACAGLMVTGGRVRGGGDRHGSHVRSGQRRKTKDGVYGSVLTVRDYSAPSCSTLLCFLLCSRQRVHGNVFTLRNVRLRVGLCSAPRTLCCCVTLGVFSLLCVFA